MGGEKTAENRALLPNIAVITKKQHKSKGSEMGIPFVALPFEVFVNFYQR